MKFSMARILLAGFLGDNNSSKVILDKCSGDFTKLYLENDFQKCADQIDSAVSSSSYDIIIVLGQKPVIKAIYIELVGKSQLSVIQTQYDYTAFADFLFSHGYRVKFSNNAGNYLCNHVYFSGLQSIKTESSTAKMLFVHVPYLHNILDVDHLAATISYYLNREA